MTSNDDTIESALQGLAIDTDIQSVKSEKTSTTGKDDKKKKYPELRKELFEHYGLSIRDHFIRDVIARHNLDDESLKDTDLDYFFGDALTETLTRIAEPYLSPKLFPKSEPGAGSAQKSGKLEGKSLLQVFSVRDIAKPLHKLDQLNSGNAKNRMLHFLLTDGKKKVDAVEYQHVLLLDNLPIYPGMKLQLENVEVLNGVLLLRPSSVIWIGGEVESFSKKYLAQIKARDAESRVHQKNLLKGETPPPKFEDVDTTKERKHDGDQHDHYYDSHNYHDQHLYDDDYQRKKAHRGYDPQHNEQQYYEDEDAYYEEEAYDENAYYEDEQYEDDGGHYEEPEKEQPVQAPPAKKAQTTQYQPKYQQKQQQAPAAQQPPARQYQPAPQQRQQQWNHNDYYQQEQHAQAMYGQEYQAYGQGHNGRNNNVHRNNEVPPAPMASTLAELYAMKHLPFTAYISAEIKAAYLKHNKQTNEAYIEFDISDATGKCKAMTSTYLMQWISSQYLPQNANQMNQQMVNLFFSHWGNRFINIKMELKDPQRMVVFHEIKWQ
mmetsp:Transcript_31276/g.50276  ORF Transcript_31276/g.50276 Transcript_31276/m.50276 type:complete len:546 (+) Transcript_31276:62-1699(+)